MTRIDKKFAQLKAESKKAFVSYIMAGDPHLKLFLQGCKEALQLIDLKSLG